MSLTLEQFDNAGVGEVSSMLAEIRATIVERDEARAEVERLRAFGQKVNKIRNSIIGGQCFNWSEHAYPLVAALNEAGFNGLPYPEARQNFGTTLERALKAEAEVERLRARRWIQCTSISNECLGGCASLAEHDRYRATGPLAEAASALRTKAALESLRERCVTAAHGAVRHSQQTTDQCRDAVAEAVRAVPLEAP